MQMELKQGYHMEILLQELNTRTTILRDEEAGEAILQELNEAEAERALRFNRSIPEYSETPLVYLEDLSKKLGVKGIYVKNESLRFGLKAFKGLGGTYAMFQILCRELNLDREKTGF